MLLDVFLILFNWFLRIFNYYYSYYYIYNYISMVKKNWVVYHLELWYQNVDAYSMGQYVGGGQGSTTLYDMGPQDPTMPFSRENLPSLLYWASYRDYIIINIIKLHRKRVMWWDSGSWSLEACTHAWCSVDLMKSNQLSSWCRKMIWTLWYIRNCAFPEWDDLYTSPSVDQPAREIYKLGR